MLLYRVSKKIYGGDIEGLGAKLYGGRWNNVGVSCIYTSESRALAILEYAANIELTMIPKTLAITIYDAPENEFINCNIEDLPKDWNLSPSPSSTKDYGSKLLLKENILGIKLPSIIVPDEFNYLINPSSIKLSKIKVVGIQDLVFDSRIKK